MLKSIRNKAGVASALFFLFPLAAFAHGFGQVYALSLPVSYYLIAAGITVAASFFLISHFLVYKDEEGTREKIFRIPNLPYVLSSLKYLTLFFFVLSIATGLFGNQFPVNNFSPAFFWVYFLVGIIVLSLLVDNVWSYINPVRTIASFIGGTGTKKTPKYLSVVLLFALFWFELISGVSSVPRVIGEVLALYAVLSFVLNQIFSDWFENGELFSVLSTVVGKVALFRVGENKKEIIFTFPVKKSFQTAAAQTILFICLLLAGTTFDAFKETGLWYKLLTFSHFWPPHVMVAQATYIPNTIGLAVFAGVFFLTYKLTARIIAHVTNKKSKNIAAFFGYSLVPIAAGYILAHNFSLLILMIRGLIPLLADPFAFGWHLFGQNVEVNLQAVLSATTVWNIEVVFVLLGHVVSVYYAHLIALREYKDKKKAMMSQYPMLALMVLYTVFTLWILSLPFFAG